MRRKLINPWTLPDEYQQVSFLEAQKLCSFVDTGYIPNQDTRICTKIQRISDMTYCAAYGTETPKCSLMKAKIEYNRGSCTFSTMDKGEIYRIDHNKNALTIEGNTYRIADYAAFTCVRSLYMFAVHGSSTPKDQFYGRIFYFRIYENDQSVRDMIPCIRKRDSALGFFDRVTRSFFEATGTFTYG